MLRASQVRLCLHLPCLQGSAERLVSARQGGVRIACCPPFNLNARWGHCLQGHVVHLRPPGDLPDALSATLYIAMAMPALSPFVPLYKVGGRVGECCGVDRWYCMGAGLLVTLWMYGMLVQASKPAPPSHCSYASLICRQGLPEAALPPPLAFRAGRKPDNTSLVWKARRLQARHWHGRRVG